MKLLLLLLFPVFIQAQGRQMMSGYSYVHKLKWKEFKGVAPAVDPQVAMSSTGLEWVYSSKDGIISKARCFPKFYKEDSYTTTSNLYILKHEQGHYEIAIIFSRIANDLIQSGMITTEEKLEALRSKIAFECQTVQAFYDQETNHSIDIEAQERWNNCIAQQLK